MPYRKLKSVATQLKLSGKRKMRSLFLNRKAVSVVLSTIVLTAGVLAMGIAVLYWSYSWGNMATKAYSNSEANNAKAVQERLGFEYIAYDVSSNSLTISLINWGTANSINITSVHLSDSLHQPVGGYSNPQIRDITGKPVSSLNMGSEGYIKIFLTSSLSSNSLYYIRVVSGRGRTFDSSFAT
jgi:hypothetical protein